MIAQGFAEGFGSAPSKHNPGNIKGSGGFKTYSSWEAGWSAFATYVDDIKKKAKATSSNKLIHCYSEEVNKALKNAGVKYNETGPYDYTSGNPSLRQYIIGSFVTWGDNNNPAMYLVNVAVTLKQFGVNFNVDEPMINWV